MLYRPQKYTYILVCDIAMLYRPQKYTYILVCDIDMRT